MNARTRKLAKIASESNITISQLVVLMAVKEGERRFASTAKELAEDLSVDVGWVLCELSALYEKGMVCGTTAFMTDGDAEIVLAKVDS